MRWSLRLSPLQLIEYSFDGVSINPVAGYEAEPSFSPGLVFFPGKLAISAEANIALLTSEEKFSDFGLKLKLHIGPKQTHDAPYHVEIALRGIVRMHLSQSNLDLARDRHERALVNGVSLLYGAAREMVSNVSSRSVNGPLHLPALNFADLIKGEPVAIEQDAKRTVKTTPARKRKKAAP